MPSSTDRELLAACLHNDEAAWKALVDRLGPVVWRTAWKFVSSSQGESGVQDVFQETFLRFLAHDARLLRRYDPEKQSLEFYAMMVARSVALNQLRSEKRRTARIVSSSDSLEDACAAEHADQNSRNETDWPLDAALASLSRREEEVIRLSYRESLTDTQIAGLLGIEEVSVRSTKSRALKKLSDILRNRK